MVKKQWKTYALWIVFCVAVGTLSGLLSADATAQYNALAAKPPLSPPSWVFPVVWMILFILMGVSASRIYLLPDTRDRARALNLFLIQITVNFFWSLLFFNAQAYGFAFLWLLLLWLLVFLMIRAFSMLDVKAAWLQVPYLLWITFAAYLNAAVWLINK